MKNPFISRYLNLALFNLCVVAFLGVLLRYKIAFTFPILEQKHVLHGHSHFAFAAWIGQLIMTLLVFTYQDREKVKDFFSFHSILIWNTIIAYLMLFSFVYQGYGPFSIFFSTLSTAINYLFCFKVWRFLNNQSKSQLGDYYIKASIIFNFLSVLGTIFLMYLMINKINNAEKYLASVYFYLHFQYNGYFIFSCLGLTSYFLHEHQIRIKHEIRIFWLLSASIIPAFLLSVMWAQLPLSLYIILVLAAFVQFGAWFYWLVQVWKEVLSRVFQFSPLFRGLCFLVALTTSIKFSLQLLSIIPQLSEYAFGFRPVVIAYLHLVLLGIVSLFLIAYSLWKGYIIENVTFRRGLGLFVVGLLLNEFILMLQGMSFLNWVIIPHSNESLFVVSILMFTGILWMYQSQKNVEKR